jgi:hypothetical protein
VRSKTCPHSIARFASGCIALTLVAMTGVISKAAGLTIFSATGTEPDPLTTPFPLSLRPGDTKSVGVDLVTDQGTGLVAPTVTCCVDVTTGAQGNPPGLTMNFVFPPWLGRGGRGSRGFLLTPGRDVIATLTVAAAPSATPGQYAATISASHPTLGTSQQRIFVNVLAPTPADDTVTPCASQVNNVVVGNGTPPAAEVLPVKSAVDAVFAVKAGSPGKTTFQVGARTTDSRSAWQVTLERQDPIPQAPMKINGAIIALANETNRDKDLWTINGAACSSAPQHIHVAKGGSARITINRSAVTTVLLRRDVCSFQFIVCWASYSEPVAVFSQPAFWAFVGGRVVTLRWFASAGE